MTYWRVTVWQERRRKRSEQAGLALKYLLAAVAARTNMLGLVLADENGLVVAASLSLENAEPIAALAPFRAGRVRVPAHRLPRPPVPIATMTLDLDGTTLYLCGLGGPEIDTRELEETAIGVVRILFREP